MHVTPAKIEAQIRASIRMPQNAPDVPCDAAFGFPVVGYCCAQSPHFAPSGGREPARISPVKWLEARCGVSYKPKQIGVISWALPMPESALLTMRDRKYYPSREWILARVMADKINLSIARDLTALLNRDGIHAVAPVIEGLSQRRSVEQYGTSLRWSEQTAAVAAGLGVMRPTCGIVTRVGASAVLGSIIASVRFPDRERAVSPIPDLCRKPDGCEACRGRCPIGAIADAGFDAALCLKYQSQFVLPYLRARYGFEGRIGCDLCVTGVPCGHFPIQP